MCERRRNWILTVKDIIPTSHLAQYNNYEYDLENERKFSIEDFCHDFSVNIVNKEDCEDDIDEPWMLDAVEQECKRLVSIKIKIGAMPMYLSTQQREKKDPVKNEKNQADLVTLVPEELSSMCGLSFCKDRYKKPGLIFSGNSIWSSTERNEDPDEFCTHDPLDSYRAVFPASSPFECFETSQVIVESGGIFPAAWSLPYEVDSESLTRALFTCSWNMAINAVRERLHLSPCEVPGCKGDNLPVSAQMLLHEPGLPIPVHIKTLDTYSPISRECGLGVNFRNLILLSPPPQCSKHRHHSAYGWSTWSQRLHQGGRPEQVVDDSEETKAGSEFTSQCTSPSRSTTSDFVSLDTSSDGEETAKLSQRLFSSVVAKKSQASRRLYSNVLTSPKSPEQKAASKEESPQQDKKEQVVSWLWGSATS